MNTLLHAHYQAYGTECIDKQSAIVSATTTFFIPLLSLVALAAFLVALATL